MIVRIIKRQRINKVQYEIGDEPDFPERDALWLIEQRIAESLDGTPAARVVAQPRPAAPAPRPASVPASTRFKCCGW